MSASLGMRYDSDNESDGGGESAMDYLDSVRTGKVVASEADLHFCREAVRCEELGRSLLRVGPPSVNSCDALAFCSAELYLEAMTKQAGHMNPQQAEFCKALKECIHREDAWNVAVMLKEDKARRARLLESV